MFDLEIEYGDIWHCTLKKLFTSSETSSKKFYYW